MNGRKVAAVADDDVAEAFLQVDEAPGKAKDRHDFGGDDDVEAVLARKAIAGTAETHVMSRNARSFMSTTRFQAMRRTSNPSSLP